MFWKPTCDYLKKSVMNDDALCCVMLRGMQWRIATKETQFTCNYNLCLKMPH